MAAPMSSNSTTNPSTANPTPAPRALYPGTPMPAPTTAGASLICLDGKPVCPGHPWKETGVESAECWSCGRGVNEVPPPADPRFAANSGKVAHPLAAPMVYPQAAPVQNANQLPPPAVQQDENDDTTLRDNVMHALAENKAHRYKGVADGLIPIDDLRPFEMVRGSKAMPVMGPHIHESRIPVVLKRADYCEQFYAHASFLKDFDFAGNGVYPAGGYAGACVWKGDMLARSSDVDLFLVGHESDEAALAAVEKLAAHLSKTFDTPEIGALGPRSTEEHMKYYRAEKCITFVGTGVNPNYAAPHRYTIQVIMRRYSTTSEVIHGFDIGASAVLFDGHTAWLTEMGRLAYEHAIVVLNLEVRRSSYENRIRKYCGQDRKFRLALPELDFTENQHHTRAQYAFANERLVFMGQGRHAWNYAGQFLPAYYRGNEQRTLPSDDEQKRSLSGDKQKEDDQKGDEQKGDESKEDEPNEESEYSVGDKRYRSVYECLKSNIRGVTKTPMVMDAICSREYYRDVRDKLFETQPRVEVYELLAEVTRLYADIPYDVMRLGAIRALMGDEYLEDTMIALMRQSIRQSTGLGGSDSDAALRKLCERRCGELNALFAQNPIPLRLMGVVDATALTGPYPRAVMTAQEWYGAHWRAPQ
jgi:hypothetical protein